MQDLHSIKDFLSPRCMQAAHVGKINQSKLFPLVSTGRAAGGALPSLHLFSSCSPMLHWLKDWVLKKYLLILTEAPSGIMFSLSFLGRPGHRQLHKICLEFVLEEKIREGGEIKRLFTLCLSWQPLSYECIGLGSVAPKGWI